MQLQRNIVRALLLGRSGPRGGRTRRSRPVVLSCESLEGRVAPAHTGLAHHAVAHLHAAAQHALHSPATSTTSTSSSPTAPRRATTGSTRAASSSTSSSSNSALTSALQALRNEVQTIELASGTTVGELTAIRAAFQTLASDGLSPSSRSALQSFENSLVTAFASGKTLTGDATLLSQFEALYTSSPTT